MASPAFPTCSTFPGSGSLASRSMKTAFRTARAHGKTVISGSACAPNHVRATTRTSSGMTTIAPGREEVAALPDLAPSPLLPDGFRVPISRWTHPSTRMRELLRTERYLFGPGVYDPFGAQLVMYHGFKAVYFSGYSFAISHLGTTDMDLYSSVEIADGAR